MQVGVSSVCVYDVKPLATTPNCLDAIAAMAGQYLLAVIVADVQRACLPFLFAELKMVSRLLVFAQIYSSG